MGVGARARRGGEHDEQPAAAPPGPRRRRARRRRPARLLALGPGLPALPLARAGDHRRPGGAARPRRAEVRVRARPAPSRADAAVVGGRHPARRRRLPRGAARRRGPRAAARGDHRVHRRRERPRQPQATAAHPAERPPRGRGRGRRLDLRRPPARGVRAAGAPCPPAPGRRAPRHPLGAGHRPPGPRGHPGALPPARRGDGLARVRAHGHRARGTATAHRRPHAHRPAGVRGRPVRRPRLHDSGAHGHPDARRGPGPLGDRAVARRPARPHLDLPARPVARRRVGHRRVRRRARDRVHRAHPHLARGPRDAGLAPRGARRCRSSRWPPCSSRRCRRSSPPSRHARRPGWPCGVPGR